MPDQKVSEDPCAFITVSSYIVHTVDLMNAYLAQIFIERMNSWQIEGGMKFRHKGESQS